MTTSNVGTRKHKKLRPEFIEALLPMRQKPLGLKAQQRFNSFTGALMAVEWLNATKGTKAYQRVLNLRSELVEFLERLSNSRQETEAAKAGSEESATERRVREAKELAENKQLHERYTNLNRLLSRYAFVPALVYDFGTGVCRYHKVPKAVRGRSVEFSDGRFTVQVSETSVVGTLAQLAANRELYKVRLCEQCHDRWLVSKRKVDKFCNAKCRATFHTHNPEYNLRKAENQRRYREQLKRSSLAWRSGGVQKV